MRTVSILFLSMFIAFAVLADFQLKKESPEDSDTIKWNITYKKDKKEGDAKGYDKYNSPKYKAFFKDDKQESISKASASKRKYKKYSEDELKVIRNRYISQLRSIQIGTLLPENIMEQLREVGIENPNKYMKIPTTLAPEGTLQRSFQNVCIQLQRSGKSIESGYTRRLIEENSF